MRETGIIRLGFIYLRLGFRVVVRKTHIIRKTDIIRLGFIQSGCHSRILDFSALLAVAHAIAQHGWHV